MRLPVKCRRGGKCNGHSMPAAVSLGRYEVVLLTHLPLIHVHPRRHLPRSIFALRTQHDVCVVVQAAPSVIVCLRPPQAQPGFNQAKGNLVVNKKNAGKISRRTTHKDTRDPHGKVSSRNAQLFSHEISVRVWHWHWLWGVVLTRRPRDGVVP